MDDTVFVIDDDAAVRDSLSLLLGLRGYRTAMFAEATGFLSALQEAWRGCLLIDIRMPGMGGLALQRKLLDRGCTIPIVIITGHGDVASARDAFRANAIDFLEKPLDEGRLFAAIEEAFSRQRASHDAMRSQANFMQQLATLTPREREVMDLVMIGHHNRDIADLLGISVRTVEVYKARMMSKLKVGSIPELMRISFGTKAHRV